MKEKLEIVEFIKNNPDWETKLQEKPYCITISRDKIFGLNLIMFKYSQIDSDFTIPEVREARGLILNEDTLEPVSVPFFKFGNAGEEWVKDIDWKTAIVTEKIDGCVSFDTKIKTLNGDVTIEEICKNPEKYKIVSFNHLTNELEEDKVEGVSIKEENNNWFELELDDGRKLKVTGNHLIWCNNLNCYRRVDQLDGSEDLMII